MNLRTAVPAQQHREARRQTPPRRILVWDAPVRICHWLIALCFAGAYMTAESDALRLVHVTFGYTLGGLVAFRFLWGLAGTRHARFQSFVHGPRSALRYLRTLASGRPEHHVGHNPAGALAIVALLGLAVALVGSGWATYHELAGPWTEDLHEGVANTMLGLVGLHVVAVLASARLHRENLVRAMIDGHKMGPAAEAIGKPLRWLAVLIVVVVLGFWTWQWQNVPAEVASPVASAERHDDDRDDD